MNLGKMKGKVQIGRAQIPAFKDEETWRGFLERTVQKRSVGAMNLFELARVVDALAQEGAVFTTGQTVSDKTYKAKAAGRRSEFYEIPDGPHAPLKRKICAMWKELGYDMTSLDTRAKRQCGVEAFRWVQDGEFLQVLARDLTVRLRRKEAKQAAGKAVAPQAAAQGARP